MRTIKNGILIRFLAPCLVLAACRVPDYYELSPGYGSSEADFNRPITGYDEETYSLVFTVGWLAGAQAEAMDNLSRLDVSRAGQLTMRPEEKGVEVNVDAKSEEKSLLDSLPKPPKTAEESIGLLAWTAMLIGAAVAYMLYRKIGTKPARRRASG